MLDVGCGNGALLTRPLAELFPEIAVTGSDTDAPSLAWARAQPPLANLRFVDALEAEDRFDLVIASEVLEHVVRPDMFLRDLRERVAEGGRLIVTVPNGYGPFELMSLVEVGLNRSGAQALLRRVKRAVMRAASPSVDTLAVSPHVNFFARDELERLFEEAGLRRRRYRPRTVFCGYILDEIVRGERIGAANARLADALPGWCASDWMFELEPAETPRPSTWRRGSWASFRKRLNERRWGLA